MQLLVVRDFRGDRLKMLLDFLQMLLYSLTETMLSGRRAPSQLVREKRDGSAPRAQIPHDSPIRSASAVGSQTPGKVKQKQLPSPASPELSAQICPCIASIKRLLM